MRKEEAGVGHEMQLTRLWLAYDLHPFRTGKFWPGGKVAPTSR